jgi:DUF2934 family protein
MTTKASTANAMAEPVPTQQGSQTAAPHMPLGELARAATQEIGLTRPENRAKRPSLPDVEIYRLIQESAYYKAEARGFSPGYEEQDWLEAEAEIKARLGFGGN